MLISVAPLSQGVATSNRPGCFHLAELYTGGVPDAIPKGFVSSARIKQVTFLLPSKSANYYTMEALQLCACILYALFTDYALYDSFSQWRG